MQKTISKMKRTPYIDQNTGDYNLKYNMQNLLEDFYIPVRGNDQATKIDNLAGLQWQGIEDVTYLRDKLFAALKVPKAFMGYEKDLIGKATIGYGHLLTEEDDFVEGVIYDKDILEENFDILLFNRFIAGTNLETLSRTSQRDRD